MAQSDLTPAPRVVFDDIQGLVRFGHGHLPEAVFLLLRIKDAAAARAWLAAAPVTSARDANPLPDTALQIAFTSGGLRRLGLAEDAIAGFSDEFLSGMAGEDNRSRRISAHTATTIVKLLASSTMVLNPPSGKLRVLLPAENAQK